MASNILLQESALHSSLLPCRFKAPAMPAHTLVRERLLTRLEQASGCRLILLLAPAGSGKSLLLSQWHHSQRLPSCWLDLNHMDDTPEALFSGILASLANLPDLAPASREQLLTALPDPLSPFPEHPEQLLNQQMAALGGAIRTHSHLILDAVENISHPQSLKLLDLLLMALPENLSLILASRTPLPLDTSKLQLSEQLLFLQRQELAFTADEIRQLFSQLNKSIHLPWVTELWQQTLGWPAVIRLVSQTGDFSLTRQYLQEQVLATLPDKDLQLLRQMSRLKSSSSSLLTALINSPITETALNHLAAAGLLLTSDTQDHEPWYSLHPQLQQLLTQPEPIDPDFYTQAAQLLAAKGLHFAAAEQAYKAGQPELLAQQMQQLGDHLLQSLEPAPFLLWKTSLPTALLEASPTLLLISCQALILAGQIDTALLHLQNAGLKDDHHARLLHCQILAAQGKGDTALQQTLALYPQLKNQSTGIRVVALMLITRIQISRNQLKAARGFNREAQMLAHKAFNIELEQLLVYDQVCIEMGKGHLQLAAHLLTEALRRPSIGAVPRGRLFLLKGYLDWCQGNIRQAQQFLEEGISLLRPTGDQHLISGFLVLSLTARTEGDITAAFDWLAEAERSLHVHHPASASWQPMVTALKASLWLDQGKLDLALTWLQQLADQGFQQPLVHLPLQGQLLQLLYARALLSHRRYPQALTVLNNELENTRDYPTSGLFILAHKALALKHSRQTSAALECLREALLLAQQENFQMPFLSADTSLKELLQQLKEQLSPGSESLDFAQQLLEQVQQHKDRKTLNDPTRPLEKLSTREEQVLRLVAEGLPNKEIAERLFISLHTVKTHLRHMLRKLDARTRTQAVTRARELHLL
ncbi:MAG: hypothetical protein IBX50_15045 [Marinospirillum sp.]|uniref:LuxR C-terminal-related transcriptional regulator n=1 Tax=Marinospirillum sp. TaxID=2183934 RepID=UPI0019ECA45B|nr:LuxR C-terminal-related transcriptional regulator [Marinospirillum sp.]MBE0508006.1 hypothetical protein [Marinospirillum sp.]